MPSKQRTVAESGRLTDRAHRMLRALDRLATQADERAQWIAQATAARYGATDDAGERVQMPEGDEPHAHVSEDNLHLAYDIAQEAEVDNRAAGPILRTLYDRGYIDAEDRGRPFDVQGTDGTIERSSVRMERVWRINPAGRARLED